MVRFMTHPGKEAALAKMHTAGISNAACEAFAREFDRYASGESALLPEKDIEPITRITSFSDLPTMAPEAAEAAVLNQVAVLRLNGGIGTTMGLTTTKSLIPAHGGLSFIQIIVKQLDSLRTQWNARLPLILLNSLATEKETLTALPDGTAISLLQGVVPRLLADSLYPVSWPADPRAEWAPPGHGDLYGVLARTGLLDRLIEEGYRYLFVANADNLGASPDPEIAAWFAQTGADFAAEVVRRGPMDKKGGHFARRRPDGHVVLRETAQTPPNEIAYFQDYHRHPFANTNNLWLNLSSLKKIMGQDGYLSLPLIANHKKVAGPGSPEVVQLESAMGTAIAVFPTSELLAVDRSRFIPVKNTSDLLLLRSDAFELDKNSRLIDCTAQRPVVSLDPRYFGIYSEFERRVPVTPSLREATSFTVRGDVVVPPNYVARGDAVIE
jgi:UTP--glucose-1-phosphate uridylyltransferase